MIPLSSVHIAITCTPGTSAGWWLLWRNSTSLYYLAWSHPFSCLLLKLQRRPWVADNSLTCLPSILSSFRTVGGRRQTLSPLPINGSRVLMTLGPSWSRSDWNEPTGATGKTYMVSSVIFGSGLSWAKVMQTAHDLRPVTDHYSQAGLFQHRSLNSSFITCFDSSFGRMEEYFVIGYYCSQNRIALTHSMYTWPLETASSH